MQVLMGTTPVAYCHQPSENIVYLGCHDNETLFDNVVLKLNHLGDASAVARACQLAHGVVAVTQGVAFFHAGDDLLRSKSLDRDSYNSGDWFNAVDWTGQVRACSCLLRTGTQHARSECTCDRKKHSNDWTGQVHARALTLLL